MCLSFVGLFMKINEKAILKALSALFKTSIVKIIRIEHYRYTDKECEITIHINNENKV